MKHRVCVVLFGVAIVIAVWIGASNGVVTRYVENFTTTQYKDPLNTTACWDTVARELKLFPFVLTLIGSYDTPDWARGVYVSGDHAFVADAHSGLLVIDISNPASPTPAGSYDTPDVAMRVVVSGDHAFVADAHSGLLVIDIRNPAAPALVGTCDTPGVAHGVSVSGDYAFVADYDFGLQVIDIRNPAAPALVGSYNTPGTAHNVCVSGDYTFVADYDGGLQVIDTSNPLAPALLGNYDTSGLAYGVFVSGDYAFVADLNAGLQVIDISNPAAPTFAGTYETPDYAFDVYVSGDRAFVADYEAGLQVIDISNPTAPTLVGSYDTPSLSNGVYVSGDHAFVADYDAGLQVIDISHPVVPPLLSGTRDTPGEAWDVYVSGDHAFVADYTFGLQVIDISNPAAPILVGTCDTPGQAWGVCVSGDHAFVADEVSGLQVIDISNPTNPILVGTCDTPIAAFGVHVSGDHAFVADGGAGLQVIDISDPNNPTLVGSEDTPGWAWDLYVSGDHVFIADDDEGLQVIDISNPAFPITSGNYNTSGYARAVYVSGDVAFVATDALEAIDVSDPTNPTLLGICGLGNDAYGVCVSGDLAFVAAEYTGLRVIDISNPAAPTLVGIYDTPGDAYGVYVSGDHAFISDGGAGLQVIQVFQSEFYVDDNIGQSLPIDEASDVILRANLTTTQTNTVTWEMSGDGGLNWQGVTPNGSWSQLAVPGPDLMWRSTHAWAPSGVNPSVSQLEINWLVEAAMIDSIVDVPDDQGGWVRMYFTRSGYDFADEVTYPIMGYNIHRRIDDVGLVSRILENGREINRDDRVCYTDGIGAEPIIPLSQDMTLIELDGRFFVIFEGVTAAGAPPGAWEVVSTVFAQQEQQYVALVPSLADSAATLIYTHYYLSSHTTIPSVFFESPIDSGYSVDNIPPGVPQGFAVAYNTGSGNQLSWDAAPEPDFQYYRVYRGDSENFTPGPGNLVHETASTGWADPEYDGWNVHYKVTALDHAGNESDAASPGTKTGITEPKIPETFALYQNVPNPFNPSTRIQYDVPASGGLVVLRIYDVTGRLIRTLVNSHQVPGECTATWNARDDQGNAVATGVYFYRLTAPGFVETRKMVFLR